MKEDKQDSPTERYFRVPSTRNQGYTAMIVLFFMLVANIRLAQCDGIYFTIAWGLSYAGLLILPSVAGKKAYAMTMENRMDRFFEFGFPNYEENPVGAYAWFNALTEEQTEDICKQLLDGDSETPAI